jgi:hypothetical protein
MACKRSNSWLCLRPNQAPPGPRPFDRASPLGYVYSDNCRFDPLRPRSGGTEGICFARRQMFIHVPFESPQSVPDGRSTTTEHLLVLLLLFTGLTQNLQVYIDGLEVVWRWNLLGTCFWLGAVAVASICCCLACFECFIGGVLLTGISDIYCIKSYRNHHEHPSYPRLQGRGTVSFWSVI